MLLSNLLAIYIFLGNRFTDEPEEISSNHNRVFPISSIIMRTIIIISIFVTNPPLLLKFTFANISSGEKEGRKNSVNRTRCSSKGIVSRFPFQLATFLAAAASLKHGSDLISRPQARRGSENGLARAMGEKKRRARGCFVRQRERHSWLSSAVGELGYGS